MSDGWEWIRGHVVTSLMVQWLGLSRDTGLIPGRGAMIPHAWWSETKNIKQKQCWNKLNKDFKKNSPLKKKKSTVNSHSTPGESAHSQ